ncbi:MAG TPA: Hsp20/alpha crystallin family protein [Gaiellaceae bacterium]|jgi:HSP20 family protein
MATLVRRFDPFRELASLQNDMRRMIYAEGVGERGSRAWVPALDISESESEVVYAFDLPGIPEEKITVELEDGTLSVSAEREREETSSQDGFHRYERHFGSFERTIALPAGVSEADVKASCSNGVLELRVHKPEQPKPHRIPVAKSESGAIEGKAQKKD